MERGARFKYTGGDQKQRDVAKSEKVWSVTKGGEGKFRSQFMERGLINERAFTSSLLAPTKYPLENGCQKERFCSFLKT